MAKSSLGLGYVVGDSVRILPHQENRLGDVVVTSEKRVYRK